MFVRIAYMEEPDQTVLQKKSDQGLCCSSRPFNLAGNLCSKFYNIYTVISFT